MELEVGDVVEMIDFIPNQRIVGVYPMNNIPSPDRVDVQDLDADDDSYIGVPVSWVKRIIQKGNE